MRPVDNVAVGVIALCSSFKSASGMISLPLALGQMSRDCGLRWVIVLMIL